MKPSWEEVAADFSYGLIPWTAIAGAEHKEVTGLTMRPEEVVAEVRRRLQARVER